jgi:hypothetical protein
VRYDAEKKLWIYQHNDRAIDDERWLKPGTEAHSGHASIKKGLIEFEMELQNIQNEEKNDKDSKG